MQARWLTLIRDCEALLIPSGMAFVIPAGTGVEITQAKGGAVTINVNGQLARIDGKDCDALGMQPTDLVQNNVVKEKTATGPVALDEVWQATNLL